MARALIALFLVVATSAQARLFHCSPPLFPPGDARTALWVGQIGRKPLRCCAYDERDFAPDDPTPNHYGFQASCRVGGRWRLLVVTSAGGGYFAPIASARQWTSGRRPGCNVRATESYRGDPVAGVLVCHGRERPFTLTPVLLGPE